MKRGILPLTVVVTLLILAAFAIFVLFGVIKPFGEQAQDFDFNENLPGRDESIPTVSIAFDPDVKKSYEMLLKILKDPPEGPCIADYGGFKDSDGGLKGYSMEFSRHDGRGFVRVFNEKQQQVTFNTFDAELCVVAGKAKVPRAASWLNPQQQGKLLRGELGPKPSTIVAENFYNNWIDCGESGMPNLCEQMRLPDFTDASSVQLYWDLAWGNENAITTKDLQGNDVVTGSDIEDGGLLYVPENGKVCFFPTFGGDPFGNCNADVNGLDGDCLVEADEGIPLQMSKGNIRTC
jgi:hypothetical protein